MQQLRKWAELIISLVFTVTGEFMSWLELERLQKVYYLLASLLMAVAIAKLIRNKNLNIEKLSQPASIVDQAHNPKKKGEMILRVVEKSTIKMNNILTKGGKKMKQFIKGRGWVQWASLILTVVLLLIGLASAFIPELAVVGQNLEAYLITLGIVVAPGILAKGKIAGEVVKNLLPKKDQRTIVKHIKEWQKKLDDLYKLYESVILIAKDVEELGGSLTPEQQTQYNTYITQKNALEMKIEAEKKKVGGVRH